MKIVVTPPFTEEQKKRIMEAAGPEQPVFRLKSEITQELLSNTCLLYTSIPEDISLISIDDSELAELSETRLTSVRHPADRLGAKAAENLLAMIRNTSFDGTYEFEPEIVERDSVKRLEEQ